jgi:two-component sensor histidine kinase
MSSYALRIASSKAKDHYFPLSLMVSMLSYKSVKNRSTFSLPLVVMLVLLLFQFSANSQDLIESFHLDLTDGLAQNTVSGLAEDKYGRIWIASPLGLTYFDGNKVHQVPHFNRNIRDLRMLESTLVVTSIDAISTVDIHTLKTESFEYPSNYFYSPFNLPSGILLVQNDGLDSLFLDHQLKQVPIPASATAKKWPSQTSSALLQSDHCKIIREQGNVSWMNETDTLVITKVNSEAAIEYDPDHFFVCSEDGLHEIELIGGRPAVHHHFGRYRTQSILIDRNKNLWIGTADHGLLVVHSNIIENQFFNLEPSDNSSIACWGSFEFENSLFALTGEGVKELTSHTKPSPIELLTRQNKLTSACETDDFVLLGLATGGISKYQNGRLTPVFYNKENVLDNTVLQILANEKGYLACTKHSFLQLDTTGFFVKSIPYSSLGIGGYVMSIDSREEFYIASAISGAYKISRDFKVLEQLAAKEEQTISSSTTYQGTQYYASYGGGLMISQEDTLVPISFLGSNLLEIESLADSILWITSTTANYRLDGKNSRPFTKENGFPILENSQNGMTNLGEGNFMLCGINGAFKFNDKLVSKPILTPQILLKNQGTIIFPEQLIRIPAEAASVNIQMLPVSILDKNIFDYEYQINDLSASFEAGDYIDIDVKPGKTLFTVSVKNKSTNRATEYSWTIERLIPFWLTIWFKLIIVITAILIVIGLIGLVRFVQTRKILRREQADRKVNDERLRISAELHDNIGARLTHIISSLDIEMYKNKGDSTQIGMINSFARDTMSQLRETIWAVSDRTIFFSEFVGRAEQYCIQCNTLASSEITFESGPYADFELNPVQTINLYRIIQEAINNAVKYAEASMITVQIKGTGTEIEILVSDDGIGMDMSLPKYGTGIRGMEQRALEAGATMVLKSALGAGTSVQLIISSK